MNYNIMTQIVKTHVVQLFREQFQAKILVTHIKRYANPRREDLGKRCNCETPRRSYIKRRKRKQQSMESNKFLNDTSVQLSRKKQGNNFHVNGAVKDSGNFHSEYFPFWAGRYFSSGEFQTSQTFLQVNFFVATATLMATKFNIFNFALEFLAIH